MDHQTTSDLLRGYPDTIFEYVDPYCAGDWMNANAAMPASSI